MLHGMNGDQDTWSQCGLFKTADELTAAGTINPMIIVTPDGDNGYWLDQANNGPKYGTYVAGDLVAWTNQTFRTIQGRESRAIGGMSMGGHGALQLAMNYPDTFGVVGAHSVALRRYEQAFSFFGDQSYFRKHDPVQLFKDLESQAKAFAIWIDVGADDPWAAAATDFHNELASEGIDHEWHIWSGGHDTDYWRQHAGDYLKFYSDHLQGQRRGAL
jgi:enterochelin esterase-like enzyme